MATADEIEALLKKENLLFAKHDSLPIYFLPYGTRLGRTVVELVLTSDGQWLTLRVPIQVPMPEAPEAQAALFRKLLAFNDEVAIAKATLRGKNLFVAVDVDPDKGLDAAALRYAIDAVLQGIMAFQERLTAKAVEKEKKEG